MTAPEGRVERERERRGGTGRAREGAAAPGEGGEGGREGAAAGSFYNVPSLPSVGSRTLGKDNFVECQITALGKMKFFDECHRFTLGKMKFFAECLPLPSVFFLFCRVQNFAECLCARQIVCRVFLC